jgi:hypothetical protein
MMCRTPSWTDLREEDIAGSGFAITGYTVVGNHTALDHPRVESHPSTRPWRTPGRR